MSLPLVSTATMLPLRKPDSNVCAWEGYCHQGRRAVRLWRTCWRCSTASRWRSRGCCRVNSDRNAGTGQTHLALACVGSYGTGGSANEEKDTKGVIATVGTACDGRREREPLPALQHVLVQAGGRRVTEKRHAVSEGTVSEPEGRAACAIIGQMCV